jgi:uncharacterized membrane protein YjfL (UPF0719 family)
MEVLSGDEALVLIVSAIASAVFVSLAVRSLMLLSPLGGPRPQRIPLLISIAFGMCFLVYVLRHWADKQVQANTIYQLMFVLLGIAWTGISACGMFLLGVRIRADAIERRNTASALAAGGALLGQLLCYAGANIGGGETIWSTIIPALLATLVWFFLWLVAELLGQFSDAIALERDAASGLRLAGMLIGTGLILGRAMAGDFHSPEETLYDFVHQGWPATLVVFAGIFLHLIFKPRRGNAKPNVVLFGLLPFLLTVIGPAIYVAALGGWNKH